METTKSTWRLAAPAYYQPRSVKEVVGRLNEDSCLSISPICSPSAGVGPRCGYANQVDSPSAGDCTFFVQFLSIQKQLRDAFFPPQTHERRKACRID